MEETSPRERFRTGVFIAIVDNIASQLNKRKEVNKISTQDNLSKIKHMYAYIKSNGLENTFPNLEVALRMFLTLSVTNCTAEQGRMGVTGMLHTFPPEASRNLTATDCQSGTRRMNIIVVRKVAKQNSDETSVNHTSQTALATYRGLTWPAMYAIGLTWPAMYAIVGQWIPSSERSRFMSSFQGLSCGIGLTYPLAGYLIAYSGWRSVFYTTGSIGVVWCIFWYFFAFDAPQKHPRISKQELEYIEANISSAVQSDHASAVIAASSHLPGLLLLGWFGRGFPLLWDYDNIQVPRFYHCCVVLPELGFSLPTSSASLSGGLTAHL
ncbi:hypothetical protein J6590_007510 [Homalodisca vitripennis]|nr:hypothetical protein J6590_007510 [Homalodisca vitripennis]